MDQSKIEDLETRLMYQEETIEQLNAIVTRQNLEIASMQSKITKLQDQADQLMPLLMSKPADEPPPPHY